jgi:hypothetical protein
MVRGTCVAITAISILAVSALSAGQTEQRPRDYVRTLVRGGAPVGLVMGEVAPRATGWMSPRKARPDESPPLTEEALIASLEGFNSAKGSFKATRPDDVVYVKDVHTPVEVKEMLQRRQYIQRARGIGALAVVFQRVLKAMGGQRPRAVIGSGPMPEEGPGCPMLSPVDVPDGSISAIDLLDQTVRQAPGLAWIVTYRSDSETDLQVRVGLLCSTGEVTIGVLR